MAKPLRLNIKSKIVLGYLFIIVCLGISIFIVVDRISSLQNELDSIAGHDIEVQETLNQIEIEMLRMVRGQLGYMNTGTESYLEEYNQSKAAWQEQYAKLFNLTRDNPGQQGKLAAIRSDIEEWIRAAGDRAIKLRQENSASELAEFLQKNTGRSYVDSVQDQIAAFRSTEKALTNARIARLEANNDNLKLALYLVLILESAGSIAVGLFISSSISGTVKRVTDAIRRITSSEGEIKERIYVNTRDEIKDLADATNELLGSVEKESWIQSGIAGVSTMYQGINNAAELAGAFLDRVAPLLEAPYAAVYLRKESGGKTEFVRAASFAGKREGSAKETFALGEGLIGQCASDQRIYLLHELPEHYVEIHSGLGGTAPKSLLVAPVFYEGRTVAVVEFASLLTFEAKHLTFLDEIQDSFGAAITSVLGRMEIERLLNESQLLTEELQAQSEELQAQSEELQMQQEQLRLANDYLDEQRRLAEQRASELEEAKDELESYSLQLRQSSQYKSDFLANMSHELRTPLNSILILSQMLHENENGTLTEEEVHYSGIIHSAGKDLLALIDDILDLSKIEAGKFEVVIDEVNVTELPLLLRQMFEPVAASKGLAFDIEVAPDAPALLSTDAHRLQHILKNLLSNAFKFTEQGSVTLRIGLADKDELRRAYGEKPPEHVLAFAVEDTGIGIPKDKQEVIFGAFQQVDGTTNRQYGGTGLGLSISREFARLLGGRVAVRSELGEGSIFTLYLPSIREEDLQALREAASDGLQTAVSEPEEPLIDPSPDEVAASVAGTMFQGRSVLLVDDDARNLFALQAALSASGITVTVADNGRECLDILESGREFDLVLMDIMMPVMDGYETMRRIRRDARYDAMPIIALTAKAMKKDRDKCLEAGASDYISKPLNMDQLFSLMRVWLTK